MIVIYIIINLVNDKVYIGSTKNIVKRFNTHKNQLNQGIHHNNHLQNAWNKYGANAFEFKTLMVCSDSERVYCEQMLINLYDSQNRNNGYNIRDADEFSHSEETKLKLSEINKNKTLSEETKQKISKSMKGENHPMFDKIAEDNPNFKNYARIVKNGFWRGKQTYCIKFHGEVYKTSISINKLEWWFKDNYPNEELVIDVEN